MDQIDLIANLYTRLPDNLTISDARTNRESVIDAMRNDDFDPYISRRLPILNDAFGTRAFSPSFVKGAAILVAFPDYPVNTDSFYGYTEHVGHGGVILINRSGLTKFYDYGRYSPEGAHGRARRIVIPNVDMKGGQPTEESLKHLMSRLSARMQQQATGNPPQRIRAAYFRTMNFGKMNAFAKNWVLKSNRSSPAFDPTRKKYSIRSFNCGHFAETVILRGNPKVDRPWMLIPTPNNFVDEYIEEGNAEITYDPSANAISIGWNDANESDAKLP